MAIQKLPAGNWKAFESASYRGEWGVETDDEKLVGLGEEIILFPNHGKEIADLLAAGPSMVEALTLAREKIAKLLDGKVLAADFSRIPEIQTIDAALRKAGA